MISVHKILKTPYSGVSKVSGRTFFLNIKLQ